MDFGTIVSAIASVGFPIVFCLILSFFIWHMQKKSEEREEKLTSTLNTALSALDKYADEIPLIKEELKEIKNDIAEIKKQ